VNHLNPRRPYCGCISFIGHILAPFECLGRLTRPYSRKLKRYRHVALAGSRVLLRFAQQVEGWACRGEMRLTAALVPPRVWELHGQRASRTGGKKG
jgi:hypothetical protein